MIRTLVACAGVGASLAGQGVAQADDVVAPVLIQFASAPTDADIASRVATTRETVNRELSEMVEAGVIEKHGRTLVIPSIEKLRRLAAEAADS